MDESTQTLKRIRLSYTLLSLWDRGDVDGAVSTYFHLDRFVTPAMENGKKVHEELEQHIIKFRSFPDWFFDYELENPEAEKIVVVDYNEMFTLKGIFDALDGDTMFEFKTGGTDSLAWARTWQLPLYFLIAELAEIEIAKAILIRNDGKKSDFVVVHNSKKKKDMARNIIDSCGPEIHAHFEREGLI